MSAFERYKTTMEVRHAANRRGRKRAVVVVSGDGESRSDELRLMIDEVGCRIKQANLQIVFAAHAQPCRGAGRA